MFLGIVASGFSSVGVVSPPLSSKQLADASTHAKGGPSHLGLQEPFLLTFIFLGSLSSPLKKKIVCKKGSG